MPKTSPPPRPTLDPRRLAWALPCAGLVLVGAVACLTQLELTLAHTEADLDGRVAALALPARADVAAAVRAHAAELGLPAADVAALDLAAADAWLAAHPRVRPVGLAHLAVRPRAEVLVTLPRGANAALVPLPLLPLVGGVLAAYGLLALVAGLLAAAVSSLLRRQPPTPARDPALTSAKSNFTSMVSHELKAPVAVLRLYAEMLRDGMVGEAKRRKFYVTMAEEAMRLQGLIDNLLDLAKIQAGTKAYRLVPERVEQLVEDALRLVETANPARRGLVTRGRTAPGVWVLADKTVALQAIANLITNALKYGAGRSVEIEVEQQGAATHVRVLDRGPGIPAAERERIFEPYVRGGNEDTREQSGTGLGLALVAAYMNGHEGGGVDVQDRPGGGSIFTLTFRTTKQGERR